MARSTHTRGRPRPVLAKALVRAATLFSSSASDDILGDLLALVQDTLRCNGVAVSLCTPGTADFECALQRGTCVPPGAAAHLAGVEAEVARTGRDRILPEAGKDLGSFSAILVPLPSADGVEGVLTLFRGDPLATPEEEWLVCLAAQTGLWAAHRRLHQVDQVRSRQLLALQRVSRQMTVSLHISTLLDLVVEEAIHLTGAETGRLYLLDPGGQTLHLLSWAGAPPPPGREEVAMGYGIAGWVARNGKSLRVADRGHPGEAGYSSTRSQLAVPLLSEQDVLGVLAVEGPRPGGFSATHEELLSMFAAQAAKAIEAARLLRQIQQERDLRDRILGGTPNGVIALDPTRRVMLMNQSARRFLDVNEPPEGNPVERYLSHPRFLDLLHRVLEGGTDLESVEIAAGPPEYVRSLLVRIFSLGDGDDRAATLILQDMTERRALDEQVQRMARLASIGQLAAGIAHEIRNPLTGIAISLDLLGEEPLSDAGRGVLADINREIDRLESLVRGLLDFARPLPVERRAMPVAKALEWHRTFREQCRKREVDFFMEGPRNSVLNGDPERLKQLFLNLAINALDATPQGGRIRIRTEVVPGEPHSWVRVVVEDTGPGMDSATLDQIFNPFFTTKNEGTGLGLSIAHSVVEQHGGRIDVRSRPGEGTQVTVDLPRLEATED